MSLSVTAKKTLAAIVLAAPLMLAACGSDTETTAEETTTTAETTTEATVAEETSSEGAPEDEGADAEGAEGAEGEGTASAGAAGRSGGTTVSPDTNPAAALDEAFADNQITFAQLPPVETGGPANEADAAEIEGLVRGMYDTTTLHEFMNYLPANTCSTVLEAQGGAEVYSLEGVPNMPLNQIPQYVDAQPRIDSVHDVRVDGEIASATVVAVSADQNETSTQRFQREDGAWKFCN